MNKCKVCGKEIPGPPFEEITKTFVRLVFCSDICCMRYMVYVIKIKRHAASNPGNDVY